MGGGLLQFFPILREGKDRGAETNSSGLLLQSLRIRCLCLEHGRAETSVHDTGDQRAWMVHSGLANLPALPLSSSERWLSDEKSNSPSMCPAGRRSLSMRHVNWRSRTL